MLSMYSNFRLSIALIAMIFSAHALAEGDAARGEVLADACKGCHAVDSYTNVYPTYHVPRVAGQNSAYLVAALTLYRDGDRAHPTMTAQAASFSDQEIQDVSAYLAAAGPQPDMTATAEGKVPEAAAVCAACHGVAGVSPIPTNPNLAGQHLDYLEETIAQYERGDRKGPNAIAMQAQMSAVSEEDIAAILEFYALQTGVTSLPMD